MTSVVPAPVAVFGRAISAVLDAHLGNDLVGVYFVGSVALGGYVPGESDIDIVAVCEHLLPTPRRSTIATAIADVTIECPARGLEFTLYRRGIASRPSSGAAFEVNANGGPRMDRLTRVSPDDQPGFWYLLDRAIAHRHGIAVTGPTAAEVFADVSRHELLHAMQSSMRWHRAHERATLYSVLNAVRAWRFASENVLGSKLEGATWARLRWPDPAVIDTAVDLRHGRPGELEEAAVDHLLDHVEHQLAATLTATETEA
jgi:hypothetical protein